MASLPPLAAVAVRDPSMEILVRLLDEIDDLLATLLAALGLPAAGD